MLNTNKAQKSAAWVLSIALVCVLFALLSVGARHNSLTFDEPSHLAAGYTFLTRGTTWTVPLRGHPLLVNAWEALPFYLGTPRIPVETLDGWGQDYLRYVESFSPYVKRNVTSVEAATRAPAILLTVLLASVVLRWGMDVGGLWTGLLALGIMVFDPTLLAHGRLATNDVGVTALGTLGLFVIQRWTQTPNWRRAAGVGIVLGLTLLAKASGILWVGVGLGWSMWSALRQRNTRPFMWVQALIMCAIAFLLLWAMYGFSLRSVPGWPSVPVPAPRHWTGIVFQTEHLDKPIMYALGQWRSTGWVWFFPLAFAIKNPAPLLIGVLLGIYALLRHRCWWRKLEILSLFSLLYVLVAVIIGPNIGYRHLLPIHTLLYQLIAGGVVLTWPRIHKVGRWGIVALGVWYVVGTLRVYPYNLAFFNELAGGPANGWRYLEGSNTDWGQGWKALREFREDQALTINYSGPEGYARTASYDLWDVPLPPLNYVLDPLWRPWLFPEPGDYVISANTLSGSFLVDPDNFAWFRYHAPDSVIADTLYYYHVDAALAPTWLAQCTVPAAPLSADAAAEGFGDISLRSMAFDCSQSWVYPDGGETRGMYALHGENLQPPTSRERLHLTSARPVGIFAERHLADVPLGFRQWDYRELPAFALFEWTSTEIPNPSLSEVRVGPAEADASGLSESASQLAPINMDGPLDFLGVKTFPEGDVLEIETWWRVTDGPITRPVSVMAHLVDTDGAPIGVADGFGVAPLTLASGDVVVQRHRFAIPPKKNELWLRTGGYWLDSGDRWTVAGKPGVDAVFVYILSPEQP